MKKEVIQCLVWFTNKSLEIINYEGWTSAFKEKQIKESSNKMYDTLEKYIDVTTLTIEECLDLGFRKWDDVFPDLYMFPLWFVPLLPNGLDVMDINGRKFKYFKSFVDTDIRLGCISFGIEIKELN